MKMHKTKKMIVLKHDIRMMKWKIRKTDQAYIYAWSHTFYGRLILRLRGYKKVRIGFGDIMAKRIGDKMSTDNKKPII